MKRVLKKKKGSTPTIEKTPTGRTIWLVGESGSGKSTIGAKIAEKYNYFHIDEETYREMFTHELSYSEADTLANVSSAALFCKQHNDEGLNIVISLTAPTKAMRDKARLIIGKESYIEVYAYAPDTILEERTKEKEKKVDIPFDVPMVPSECFLVNTEVECSAESAHNIIEHIDKPI